MTVKEIQTRIESLQRQIKTEEEGRARMEGQLHTLQEELKRDFSISTVPEIDLELSKLNARLTSLEQEKAEIVKELDSILAEVKV